MKHIIDTRFTFDDLVFLKSDPINVRQVTSILLKPGQFMYGVSKGTEEESWVDESQIIRFREQFVVKGFSG